MSRRHETRNLSVLGAFPCDCEQIEGSPRPNRSGSLAAIEACNDVGDRECLLVLGIVLIFATPWVADLFRHFGDRSGGPPTHPLPVSSPVETSRTTGHSEESASIR